MQCYRLTKEYVLLFGNYSPSSVKLISCFFSEAWKSLTDKVQEARSNARLKALSFDGIDIVFISIHAHICFMNLASTSCISHRLSLSGVNGLKMLGVVHDAVVFLLEQLYGARHCRNYRFRFHKPEESKDPPVNPHGSARAEVYHRCVSWPGWAVFILAIPENPKPFYKEECKVMIVNTQMYYLLA